MGAAIKVVIDRTTPNEGEGPATARSPAMLRPEMMARREAAAQEINRRCEPLLQMGDGSQFQQGDPFAMRRRDAINGLVGNNLQALFGQSGVELAAQGLLHTLANCTRLAGFHHRRYFGRQHCTTIQYDVWRVCQISNVDPRRFFPFSSFCHIGQ